LLDGRVDRAAEGFDHAFALACQVDDPCWQGLAGRGAGLIEVVRTSSANGIERLRDARARCSGLPDSYQWVIAYVLDAMCTTAVRADLEIEDLVAETASDVGLDLGSAWRPFAEHHAVTGYRSKPIVELRRLGRVVQARTRGRGRLEGFRGPVAHGPMVDVACH